MAGKQNPRRIPRTQADVDKAADMGRLEGVEFAITSLLWILVDKHDAPAEDIKTVHDEIEYLWDSIVKGYVSFQDIKKHLKDEYDWEFIWRRDDVRKML